MTRYVFAWTPAGTRTRSADFVAAVVAAWHALPNPPDGLLKTGYWLGHRATAAATQQALAATFVDARGTGALNTLDTTPRPWSIHNELYLVQQSRLTAAQALTMHWALCADPAYVGLRSLTPEDTRITQILLDEELVTLGHLAHGQVLLPCILDDHEFSADPLTPACRADAWWQESLQSVAPVAVAHLGLSPDIEKVLAVIWGIDRFADDPPDSP